MAVLGASLFSIGTQAADICTAVALRDVPAIEDSSSMLKKGQFDTAITQYRVNKRTGETSFCSHGGYCYPIRIQVGGGRLEALKLTNCQVADNRPPFDEGEYLDYEVEPIRTKVVPAKSQPRRKMRARSSAVVSPAPRRYLFGMATPGHTQRLICSRARTNSFRVPGIRTNL